VSYCQLDDGAVCAGPLKSSLNTVDQPGGGAGTAAGKAAARAVAAREAAAGVVAAATAGTAGAVSAMIDVTAAASAARRRPSRRDVTTAATRASLRPSRRNATTVTVSASRRPPRRGQSGAAWGALRACRSEPFIGRNLPRQNYKESFLFIDATISRGPGGVNTGICLAVVGYGRLASPCAAMDEGNGLRHSGEVRTRAASTGFREPGPRDTRDAWGGESTNGGDVRNREHERAVQAPWTLEETCLGAICGRAARSARSASALAR
jgi:hypothetical protein